MSRTTLLVTDLLILPTCLIPAAVHAGDAAQCVDAAGTLLVGTIKNRPTFKSGTFLKGVELSHTHLTLRNDADGKNYDVAIDNVFANGYHKNGKNVPAPLNTLAVGDRIEACGQTFKGGIHWVHTNCGDSPTPQDPNGWIRKLQPDGSAGPNMESSQTYCYLWPRH